MVVYRWAFGPETTHLLGFRKRRNAGGLAWPLCSFDYSCFDYYTGGFSVSLAVLESYDKPRFIVARQGDEVYGINRSTADDRERSSYKARRTKRARRTTRELILPCGLAWDFVMITNLAPDKNHTRTASSYVLMITSFIRFIFVHDSSSKVVKVVVVVVVVVQQQEKHSRTGFWWSKVTYILPDLRGMSRQVCRE